MDNFSDEQFQHLLESLTHQGGNEQFETFLGNLEEMPDLALFNSFCDPTLVPAIDAPETFLSFPPLPAIEEEEYSPPRNAIPPCSIGSMLYGAFHSDVGT